MPKTIIWDDIKVLAWRLSLNDDGTWSLMGDYAWTASASPGEVRPRPSRSVALTAGQQTTIATFTVAKLADLKAAEGI